MVTRVTGGPGVTTLSTGISGPLTTPGSWSVTSTPVSAGSLVLAGDRPLIRTQKNEIDLDDLADTMKVVKERLLMITPDFEKHEKYPMLKQAYEHYKLVEKMLMNGDE